MNGSNIEIMKKALYFLFVLVMGVLYSCKEDEQEPLRAEFSSNKQTVAAGETVYFMDKSAGSPVRWDWEFEGGEPAKSNLFSPEVVFNQPGKYSVKLKVGRGPESSVKEVTEYITVLYPDEILVDFKADKAKIVLSNYQRFYQKLAFRNKDLSRLNIFTTNNDLFNETALDSLNIHYINGFGGGINKFFNPALFSYIFSKRMDTSIEKYEPVENMVNLYKIHGSVNWIEDNSNVNTFFKIREVSYPEKLKAKTNILIYPTPTKQNKSLGSPYVELFREFQKKLLIPHSVLFVIGYSFSDEHVNNIIYQALATNSTINIVIINDVCNKEIAQISDNRIFRIWGNVDVDGDNKTIHYFDYIVNNLLPDVDATKNQDTILKQFIDYYNKKQPE